MVTIPYRSRVLLAALLFAVAFAAAAAPCARAQSYTDVPKSHWARAYIAAVTERSASGHRLLGDYGSVFKPEAPITRALLARSLVLASGHYGEKIDPVAIKDVGPGHRYYSVIQMAGAHVLDRHGVDLLTVVTGGQHEGTGEQRSRDGRLRLEHRAVVAEEPVARGAALRHRGDVGARPVRLGYVGVALGAGAGRGGGRECHREQQCGEKNA